MKVRFEELGKLIDEVSFPHAELPLGDDVVLRVEGERVCFRVLGVAMVAEGGELKAVVDVSRLPRKATGAA
jgi:hypothetical protein